MIRIRPALAAMPEYVPGRSAESVAAKYAIGDVIKLASNEAPFPPLPSALAAIADAAGGVNRYPDDAAAALREQLARALRRRARAGAARQRFGRALPHGARRHVRPG